MTTSTNAPFQFSSEHVNDRWKGAMGSLFFQPTGSAPVTAPGFYQLTKRLLQGGSGSIVVNMIILEDSDRSAIQKYSEQIFPVSGGGRFPISQGNRTNKDGSTLGNKFKTYADKWHREILNESTIQGMTSNVNYLGVISLGYDVVPHILKDLKARPAPWFLALEVLTNRNDIGKKYAGNFRKIADAWLAWGTDNGLLN